MKEVTYQPLWLLEWIINGEIITSMIVTKNIPVKAEREVFSTGIFTKTEQITFGQDLYGTSNLREIYRKASDATFDFLVRLVLGWRSHAALKKLRQEALR